MGQRFHGPRERRKLGIRIHGLALGENLRKHPLMENIGLIFPARRMIRDIEPNLQNIGGRDTVALYCCAEHSFRISRNSDEYVWLLTGDFK